MLVLIDGCNVLHVEGVLPPEIAGLEAAELAALITASRYRLDEVLIVMDGPRGERGSHGGVRIVHSGPGRTADEVIIDLVRRSSTPRSILVVSSDREIRREATRRRSKTLSSEAFLAQLGRDGLASRPAGSSPRPAPDPAPNHSTQHWIEAFGVTEADLTLPPEMEAPGVPEVSGSAGRTPAPSGTNREPGATPSPDHASTREGHESSPGESAPSNDTDEETTGADSTTPPVPKRPRRALEDVRSLDEIDPRELERFDMGEWFDGGS
jgi:uncharacterized protein